MAGVAIKVVFHIGKFLWRRHKEHERRERFFRILQFHTAGMHDALRDTARSAANIRPRMDVRYLYNGFPHIKNAMHAALEETLDSLADTAVRSAKRRAPRDEGELRASIGRTPVQRTGRSGYEVVIYATAPHAAFLEFGAVHMNAHPFLRPAVRAARKRLPREVKKRIPQR